MILLGLHLILGLLLDGKGGQRDLLVFEKEHRDHPVVNRVVVLALHLQLGKLLGAHHHLDNTPVELHVDVLLPQLDHQVVRLTVLFFL